MPNWTKKQKYKFKLKRRKSVAALSRICYMAKNSRQLVVNFFSHQFLFIYISLEKKSFFIKSMNFILLIQNRFSKLCFKGAHTHTATYTFTETVQQNINNYKFGHLGLVNDSAILYKSRNNQVLSFIQNEIDWNSVGAIIW